MKKLIFVLVAVNLCGLLYFAVRYFVTRKSDVSAAEKMAVAKRGEEVGIMTAQEQTKLSAIGTKQAENGILTDGDVAFTCDLFKRNLERQGLAGEAARLSVFGIWRKAKSLSPSQQEQIIPVLTSLLNRNDDNLRSSIDFSTYTRAMAGEKAFTAEVIGNIGNPKNVPLILPLLKSKEPRVQKAAKESLSKLGYKG